MTDHIHPQRETYPLVSSNDELVMVFRDHLPTSLLPVLYVKSLDSTTTFRVDSSRTLDERAGYVVLDYTAGALNTVTLTVNGGAPTVLTEDTDFDAVVSNEETARQIADAINTAAVGLTASTVIGEDNVYVVPDAGINTFTLNSNDLAAWDHRILASIGALVVLGKGHTTELDLPVALVDPIKKVSFLRVLTGKVSVDLRSPVEVRTYFRQPLSLRATTGQPGGWPTA